MTQKLLIKTLPFLVIVTILCFLNPVSAGQPSAPQVRVMTIEERNVVPASEYVGHVEALQTVELRARVEGFLEEVSFTEGDMVRKGQILYRIEPDGYKARVAMEKARVAQAEARVAQAEAELTRARSHLKRMRSVTPQSISALDLDNAMAAELAAQANLSAAMANLAAAGGGPGRQ